MCQTAPRPRLVEALAALAAPAALAPGQEGVLVAVALRVASLAVQSRVAILAFPSQVAMLAFRMGPWSQPARSEAPAAGRASPLAGLPVQCHWEPRAAVPQDIPAGERWRQCSPLSNRLGLSSGVLTRSTLGAGWILTQGASRTLEGALPP